MLNGMKQPIEKIHLRIKQLKNSTQSSTELQCKASMRMRAWGSSSTAIIAFGLLGLTFTSRLMVRNETLLKVGIIQRFGQSSTSKLQILPLHGDRLELKFFLSKSIQQTLFTSNPVQIETVIKNLPQIQLREVLILGNFRTYETAADNAQKWRSQGIEVEIAQPERWQVWAKREVYSTPLIRRMLLHNIENSGYREAYLDTKIWQQAPQLSWIVNGKRHNNDYLEISDSRNLIRVNQSENPNNPRTYAGRMKLQPNAYGTYTLINEVPLETYLRGVLPYEIGTDAPKAALEAQAIIARTYALRNLRRFAIDNYQLCADTNCQVYYGLNGVASNTDQASTSTRGMVLTYNQELVDALYSSTTGGVTAAFSDIWNGADRPYLRPIVDTTTNTWNLSARNLADAHNFQQFIDLQQGFNESGWNLFRWHKESSIQDITKDLQKFLQVKKSPDAKFKTVEKLSIVKRSFSGRILELAVKTDTGFFILYKDEVRSAFAAPVSTLFYLQPLNKGQSHIWGYAFIGGGLGHGVGLSQIGAQSLARLGWSSSQILHFYYPGTSIQKLSQEIKFFSRD